MRQVPSHAKKIGRLGKDIAHPWPQLLHFDRGAVNGGQTKVLVIVIIHGKDKAQWLALPRGGIADNRREKNGRGDAVNERLGGGFRAQLFIAFHRNAGQATL